MLIDSAASLSPDRQAWTSSDISRGATSAVTDINPFPPPKQNSICRSASRHVGTRLKKDKQAPSVSGRIKLIVTRGGSHREPRAREEEKGEEPTKNQQLHETEVYGDSLQSLYRWMIAAGKERRERSRLIFKSRPKPLLKNLSTWTTQTCAVHQSQE